jgi:hypothetical protein
LTESRTRGGDSESKEDETDGNKGEEEKKVERDLVGEGGDNGKEEDEEEEEEREIWSEASCNRIVEPVNTKD